MFRRMLSIFTGATREDRLEQGIGLSEAGKPEQAIKVFDSLYTNYEDGEFRSRVLLSKAKAYLAQGMKGKRNGI